MKEIKIGRDILGTTMYTISEATVLLNCTEITLRKYIKQGCLKSTKMGRETLISEESLKEYLQGTSRGRKKPHRAVSKKGFFKQ